MRGIAAQKGTIIMAGRYSDIVSGMLGEDIIAGADDYDLIAGLDDEESAGELELISGAAVQNQKLRAKNAMLQRALAEKISQSSTLVKERSATKGRTVPLGFDSETPVDPGIPRRIITRPQVVFKGLRPVVSPDIAGSFIILDIIVGKNSQFAASGGVPARTFEGSSVGVELDLDTAQVGQDVIMVVQNISATPTRFIATLIGKSVE
jgi:hypothetical protein